MPRPLEDYEKHLNHFFDLAKHTQFEEINCLFCSGKTKILFSKRSMEVVRCECGFVFNRRQPNQDTLDLFYNSEALRIWNRFKTNDDDERQNSKFKYCVEYVIQNKHKSVLDMGCGSGYFLNLIRKKDKMIRLVGVDIGIDTRKDDIEFIDMDYTTFFYESKEKFDVISLWGVLEHVKDPNLLLNRAKQALNPGGILITCVPNCESEIVETLWDKCFTFCPQHLWYFSTKTLDKILYREGFETQETMYIETEAAPLAKYTLGFEPYEHVESEWRDMYEHKKDELEPFIKYDKRYKIIKVSTHV